MRLFALGFAIILQASRDSEMKNQYLLTLLTLLRTKATFVTVFAQKRC